VTPDRTGSTGLWGRLGLGVDLPRREALLLLPELPREVTVVDTPGSWDAPLAAWGMTVSDVSAGDPRVALGSDVASLLRTGAYTLLLMGDDRAGRLAAAGYHVHRWRYGRTRLGTAALVPVGEPVLARQLRTGGGPRRPRQVALDTALLMQDRAVVVVASREPAVPLLPASAGFGESSAALLVGKAYAGRLPVFLVLGQDGRLAHAVKGGYGPLAGARFSKEQRLLERLAACHVVGVPQALGAGAGPREVVWSVETVVSGRPLFELLISSSEAKGLDLLERVVVWCTALARATSVPDAVPELNLGSDVLGARKLLGGGEPGGLVHGDLEHNVLVDGSEVGVIDWEKATFSGQPLHDLTPLLCRGLAWSRGIPHERIPDYLSEVMHGSSSDAVWFRGQVRRFLGSLGIDLVHAGSLMGLGLASWAERDRSPDARVVAAGGSPNARPSASLRLAPEWLSDPALGRSWPAFDAES
jgi:hypothetical protein